VRAIREEQVAALVAVPGIGRKTAERLVVELRDKLTGLGASGPAPARGDGVLPRSGRFDDAAAALVQLGYTPAIANDALRQIGAEADGLTTEDLVRRALSRLGRSALVTR
jgi:Holliday junction DNA helicase RuvA